MEKPRYIAPWARCPGCGHPIQIEDKYVIDYFNSRPILCTNCQRSLDWWATVCREIEDNFMYNQAFAFIGARTLLFQLVLRGGQRTIYRFSDYGIPPDAKVLYVNYTSHTPDGRGYFPVEIHGNVPTRRFFMNEVALYPIPVGSGEPLPDSEVNVMVSWVPRTADDESWESLVDAFEAYGNARYPSMIVPANVAVESAMSRLLTSYLERFVSKKRTEDFLENAATYAHQLNVLLPVLGSLNGLPLIPDHVRGALNRLRDLRNDLAHAGALEQPLDHRGAAELLCGALFGFHYVRHIQQHLVRT